MWVNGENPHDGEFKENQLTYELPLMYISGFYLNQIYPMCKISSAAHQLVSVLSSLALIMNGCGANIGIALGFLHEAATVFVTLMNCLFSGDKGKLTMPGAVLATVILLTCRVFGNGFTIYQILQAEEVGFPVKALTISQALISFSTVVNQMKDIFTGPPSRSRRRSRSRTRSRSRSRSRTRISRKGRC